MPWSGKALACWYPALTGGWPDAFRVLDAALPETPSIVVLDELPWLAEQDEIFDGALQTAWDRLWSRSPVFLVLLGSDLHMMERLTAYDRPFYGRADNLVLGSLNPAETGRALGLDGVHAIDAHLITGGLPGIIRSWPHTMPPPSSCAGSARTPPRRCSACQLARSSCRTADPGRSALGSPDWHSSAPSMSLHTVSSLRCRGRYTGRPGRLFEF